MTANLFNHPDLSIIVPVHNEELCLPEFHRRLQSTVSSLEDSYEILYVDDGSEDESLAIMESLRSSNAGIGIISFSRCFGKENAVTAGLNYATGRAVIIIDADLQEPPELIVDMVSAWHDGFDVVAMRRISRTNDSWFKRITAKGFYSVFNAMSDINLPTNVGDFRLISRPVVDAINQLNENNRCMKGLFGWVGYKTIVLIFERPERVAGQSKWQLFSLVDLAFSAICSFSIRPLRIATLAGFCCAGLALIYGLYTVAKTLLLGEAVAGYTTLITFVTFLGGTQLVAIGILGEYVGRTFMETKKRPLYLVKYFHRPSHQQSQFIESSVEAVDDSSIHKKSMML